MSLTVRSLSLNLPFGLGGVEIDVSKQEADAAWRLYVEFATRVTGQEAAAGTGFAGEALASVYSLFGAARDVLLRAVDREPEPELRARFDRELAELREGLDDYVDALAQIAGVKR